MCCCLLFGGRAPCAEVRCAAPAWWHPGAVLTRSMPEQARLLYSRPMGPVKAFGSSCACVQPCCTKCYPRRLRTATWCPPTLRPPTPITRAMATHTPRITSRWQSSTGEGAHSLVSAAQLASSRAAEACSPAPRHLCCSCQSHATPARLPSLYCYRQAGQERCEGGLCAGH